VLASLKWDTYYKKLDVKKQFNIQMKNVSFQSPEVLRNTTNHFLP